MKKIYITISILSVSSVIKFRLILRSGMSNICVLINSLKKKKKKVSSFLLHLQILNHYLITIQFRICAGQQILQIYNITNN